MKKKCCKKKAREKFFLLKSLTSCNNRCEDDVHGKIKRESTIVGNPITIQEKKSLRVFFFVDTDIRSNVKHQ